MGNVGLSTGANVGIRPLDGDGVLPINNFLRRFLLLKKLKSGRPSARPLDGKTWAECYTVGIHGNKIILWYNTLIQGGKVSTGAITG